MGHNEKFVNYIVSLIKKDKGAAARLRRSINETEEEKAWRYLVRFGVDIESDHKKAPYILVASSLANEELDAKRDFRDGDSSLGKAIRSCYDEADGAAEARLRRVLSCDSKLEACKVIAKIIPLIQSKSRAKISYAALLQDLCYFDDKTKRRWATDFYKNEKGAGCDSDETNDTH